MNSVKDKEWKITGFDSSIVLGKVLMWISFYPCATFFGIAIPHVCKWMNKWITFSFASAFPDIISGILLSIYILGFCKTVQYVWQCERDWVQMSMMTHIHETIWSHLVIFVLIEGEAQVDKVCWRSFLVGSSNNNKWILAERWQNVAI